LASIVSYRKQWERLHKKYERQALKVYLKTFKQWGNNIPFSLLTEDNFSVLIDNATNIEAMNTAYFDVYFAIGSDYGKRVGKDINRQLKAFTISEFISVFQRDLLTWLFRNGASRIVTVRQTYLEYIKQLIGIGIADGKSMSEISTDLERFVNRRDFYRWQAMRIARTETTTAANYSATVSSKVSGFENEKVWISTLDSRTRRPPLSHFNHHSMNQVKVGVDEAFNVSGQKMMFPGDPKGSAGNVINCRCTVAIIPKRDSRGNLIPV